jgi:hypothetical protein
LPHLRESLPSWLERLPGWDPIVVCCDDPAAAEFASGELMLAGRGFCLSIHQGQYFNKLAAERAGMLLVGQDLDSTGEAFDESWPLLAAPTDDLGSQVCLLDADIVATRGTAAMLDGLGSDDVAVCGWGSCPDDFGFLVCNAGLLWRGMSLLPVERFEGYGPEDMAIRIAIWSLIRRPFTEVPAEWAHRQHDDQSRQRWHPLGIREASRRNANIMADLIETLVPPSERETMGQECMQSPKTRSLYRAS